jgi:hypothetical protein
MLGVAFGQEHVRVNEDRPAPELGQHRALDSHVLDPLGVLRARRRGGNETRDLDLYRAVRADMHQLRIAVDVARCDTEDLDRSVIEVHPDRLAVGSVRLLVDVDNGLRVVVARRKSGERAWKAN